MTAPACALFARRQHALLGARTPPQPDSASACQPNTGANRAVEDWSCLVAQCLVIRRGHARIVITPRQRLARRSTAARATANQPSSLRLQRRVTNVMRAGHIAPRDTP